MSLKKILSVIALVDLVLALIAYFVVFYNTPGTYVVANSPLPTTSTVLSTSTAATASGTAPSSIPTSTISIGSGSGTAYDTEFTPPYPLNWQESGATISVMGAALQGNQLTLKLAVAMGNAMACIPLNLRMLVDEEGNLAAPLTPQFTFPETDSCNGSPGATYTDQQVVFGVDPTAMPFFFTTGGASNIYFEVTTSSNNGLAVFQPSANGQ
ncbi:MAG TPA: hypothetical protein VMU07_03770 [Candidatus Paceibacterota bacterium]|nr:hypothetical protein [Candidatus Paceibacterota bacterium]